VAEAGLDQVLARSRELGFLGPGPVADQRIHAEAFVGAIDLAGVDVAVDLGSGGGIPGLVLAAALPDVRWVLLDGMVRRTSFLEEAVAALGWAGRVEVRTVRAEEAGRSALRGSADLVVARSFGPPPVTTECASPLLRAGGQLVVSEPPGSAGDRWSATGLEELGLRLEAMIVGPPGFVRLRQVVATPDRYPRRVGIPTKRPLWS
jgi:16S rRNA (guanine527-N7)-methyltransferase